MRSPTTIKEVQRLTGRLAALSRFLPAAATRSYHFFKKIKKSEKFTWTTDCERAFSEFKQILASPPILQKPEQGKPLLLFLSISANTISSVLVTDTGNEQHPVYFVSKVLQGAELRYPTIEKLALGLIMIARRLRHYFQMHPIIVRTGHPLRQILSKPDLAGRMTKWAIELSEFDISYQSRGSPKAQRLADFVAEFTCKSEQNKNWELYVDGASNENGCGVGILLKDDEGVQAEQSIKFLFQTTNNQAEYEALLAGLRLAKEVGISSLTVHCDSLLVVQQVSGQFQVRDKLLEKYLSSVKTLVQSFQKFEILHIPREENCRADILSKLATHRLTEQTEKLNHITLTETSLDTKSVFSISQEEDWRNVFVNYIRSGDILEGEEPRSFRYKAAQYTLLGTELYK
ncbi:uncharacterized protein LOC130945949 [Arachis stenosperma]|uniref:uncharacterized protein LOC130945949 n=1 Tax=Arachis stenosperma TaxID=217475 RepID=UPI0025AD2267|nr:uncharacterized protein LOC130945949 [Arachis stenosperma]